MTRKPTTNPNAKTIPTGKVPLPYLPKTPKPEALTAAQRQANYRKAKKADGFTWVGFWLNWGDFEQGKVDAMDPAPGRKVVTIPEDADPISWTLGFQTGVIARDHPNHAALITHRIRPPKTEEY